MATRYGDANENGQFNYEEDVFDSNEDSKRRLTKHCIQTAAASALHQPVTFREFTRESLKDIQKRKVSRAKRTSEAYLDPARARLDGPDPYLASGQQLPPALVRQLPPELVGKPIEDIDPYYADQKTFVIISRGKELTRFSAKKALYLLGPFHPIRRVVLYILISSLFNLLVILTILTNCILMTIQGSEIVERTEIIFTIIYTTELGLKVLARGFILDQFTYLRDPWNWLDFMVIIMAYLTIVVQDLGNLSVMRTFRVLRALKTVAIIPGMKTIVGAVIDSVKNLKDVVVLTLFSLSVFSLLGLQIYMGLLTQKCILNGATNMSDSEWHAWCNTSSHWIPDLDSEIFGSYRLCGNATGAQSCPLNYTCLQGFGPNPDYGYTNFDTFGWALICSFRLMTQDFWEGLYMQVLKTAGSWHIIFFIVSIFLGSIYLMNLILAIVAMSYNELQRRAEEEEEAAAEDEAAFLESCRLMELHQEQMSQFSRSTDPDAGTSYRPSVEIGLVGQSLLASLCQKGLLGERVRETLEQQLMLPEYANSRADFNTDDDNDNNNGNGNGNDLRGGAGGGGGRYGLGSGGGVTNRSHSLSVNLDYPRRSSSSGARHCSQQWAAGYSPTTAGAGAAGAAASGGGNGSLARRTNFGPYQTYDPLMMAISMTELRRKSSVRTNDSYSPTKYHYTNSTTNTNLNGSKLPGSMLRLGQRRLLPNIGLSGKRLDRHDTSPRRKRHATTTATTTVGGNNKLAPRYVSSGVLPVITSIPGGVGRHPSQEFAQAQAAAAAAATAATTSGGSNYLRARSSMTSDKDLEILRQKAAMIRINDILRKRVDYENASNSLEDTATERCSSEHSLAFNEPKRSSSIQINPITSAATAAAATVHNQCQKPRSSNQDQDQDQSAAMSVAVSSSTSDPTTSGNSSTETDTRATVPVGAGQHEVSFDLEAAICEQPTRTHPSGRLFIVDSNQSLQQQQQPQQLEQRHGLKSVRKLSTVSQKQMQQQQQRRDSLRASILRHRRRSTLDSGAEPAAGAAQSSASSSLLARRHRRKSTTNNNNNSYTLSPALGGGAPPPTAGRPGAASSQMESHHNQQQQQQQQQQPTSLSSEGAPATIPLRKASASASAIKYQLQKQHQHQHHQQFPLGINQKQSSSTKTLHKRHQNSPTDNAISFVSGSTRGADLSNAPGASVHHGQRLLAVDNYLKPADKMHHLSVENFQQFGAIRPTVSSMMMQQQQQQQQRHHLQAERKHSLMLDSQMARMGTMGAGRQQAAAAASSNNNDNDYYYNNNSYSNDDDCDLVAAGGAGAQSLRQRGSRVDGRGAYINPATMVRSSFSRIRQSIVPPPTQAQPPPPASAPLGASLGLATGAAGAAGAATLAAAAPFEQQQQQQVHYPAGSVRRVSRDLVRHASDWSRMSMSTNVDLRRLLRLWSHTNPYQGARPSIGSCSIYSQTNQSARFNPDAMCASTAANYNFDCEPQLQHQQQPQLHGGGGVGGGMGVGGPFAAASVSNSPRPSSVGSQAWQAYEVLAALSRRENRYQSQARAYGGALPLDDNLNLDEVSISMRDKCLAYCLSCLDIMCIWECCNAWLKVQRIISLVVFDPFTELFIILCILINTLFMALDSDDADDQMRQIFERGNYFFTATFAVEASMKIIALSPKFYFREGWNVFDSFIVGLSLIELGLEGVYGLSVLRSFRLLRVFKLAKSWPTLNLLISIMGKAVGDLGNLTFVLTIIVFIFAVMGMQLFGTKYVAKNFPNNELPRWNFTDFMHSFMIVFRILCAEWIEPMWDCLLVGGWPCIPFFLIAVTVGNLVVLNLFLALLLASFGASNLSSPQADNVDTKKLQEAIERFKRFERFLRRLLIRTLQTISSFVLRRKRSSGRSSHRGRHRSGPGGGRGGTLNGGSPRGSSGGGGSEASRSDSRTIKSHIVTMSRLERLQNIERRTEELKSKIRRSPEHHYHLRQLARLQLEKNSPAASDNQLETAAAAAAATLHGPGSQIVSLNYNYPSQHQHEQQPHHNQHQQQQHQQQRQRLFAAGCNRQELPATIPIIVNEALESIGHDEDNDNSSGGSNSNSNTDNITAHNNSMGGGGDNQTTAVANDSGDNCYLSNNNKDRQQLEGSRAGYAASDDDDDDDDDGDGNGNDGDDNHSTGLVSSLNSDISLNVAESSAASQEQQVSLVETTNGNNGNSNGGIKLPSGLLLSDRNASVYSNMQTIREDSRDDSSLSVSQTGLDCNKRQQLELELELQQQTGRQAVNRTLNEFESAVPGPVTPPVSNLTCSQRRRHRRQSKSMDCIRFTLVAPIESRNTAAKDQDRDHELGMEPERIDDTNGDALVELSEPLLAKSSSEPDYLSQKRQVAPASSSSVAAMARSLSPSGGLQNNQATVQQQQRRQRHDDTDTSCLIELPNAQNRKQQTTTRSETSGVNERCDCYEDEPGREPEPEPEPEEEQRPKSSLYLRPPKRQDMDEEDELALQHIETYIEKCICFGIVCLKWFLFRQHVRKIVEHKYFDQCILILIIISSGTLALEDKHLNDRPTLKRTLDILDTIFTIIFSLEMIFKWLAFGMRRYFGNIWSWLDFVIVLVSFVNLMASIFGSGKIQALKTMRTLRAMRGLRPLRALQRFQGMRVVVNALIQAIPSIFNVLLVCLIFWLIFSIMGVQMFGGKFWRCLSPDSGELVSYELAANKIECLEKNLTWSNPQINFDNVLNAYLALFQVATFKGWIDIMNSATDSRMRDDQPVREANIYMYLYFVFFVIFGSFFTLNLFIGVIIDNFNEQKKKTGGSLEIFMTDDQKKYYHAMKKMRSKKPTKAMTRPKFKPQAYMFDLTTSKKFDLAIMLIIGLNMFVMALEHYGQSQEFSNTLESLNLIFIAIFTLECLCKIFAMRHFYFREPWNIFDFIVVDLSILGVVMKEYVAKYFVSPTLLRVVRVVKVGRVLRLVKGAKGIRTLLFALAMSLPALFNICLLLFLVMFIYAIFGMSFFMNVRKRSGIDETFNFETFTSSIIVLFQMSTSAGWDLVLDPLMDEENDCQKPDAQLGIEGTCGNKSIAIFYLISYVIVTFLIIINMYIAVILENYSQATEDVQEGLTDDDYEMYYEIWQKFDPDGTQYLPYDKLSDFVDALEDPLRIPKPNELALVVLDINIYKGNQCYCVDILDALTKFFFTRKGLDIQVNEHLQQVQQTLHETPFERITTTYMLKREHYCAKVIQNCWRRWREQTAMSSAAALIRSSGGGGGGTEKTDT